MANPSMYLGTTPISGVGVFKNSNIPECTVTIQTTHEDAYIYTTRSIITDEGIILEDKNLVNPNITLNCVKGSQFLLVLTPPKYEISQDSLPATWFSDGERHGFIFDIDRNRTIRIIDPFNGEE